jgi:hypothetical protein
VLLNGQISATPVEVVRVWLGKYEAGDAVIADYSGAVVQFNLTKLFSGTATLNDDLSGWGKLSSNASIIDSYFKQLEDAEGGMDVALFSGSGSTQTPDVLAVDPVIVDIIAAFTYPLAIAAVTYLGSKFVNLFAANLQPEKVSVVKTASGDYKLEVTFKTPGDTLRANGGSSIYETAVTNALAAAKKDAKSGLAGETWSLTETRIAFAYGV